ncbi:MAG TPA: DUF4331 family protein [Gemmatimonadales bacterium]|jgi:hypothetical protein|nr:DUF4331 family protein [Gemmatimonadales bacterium]
MPFRAGFRTRAAVLGLAVIAAAGATGRQLIGSDHQDTPFVELNPKTDLTDVYAFPGASAGRIVLAMDTRAFLTPAETQDPSQASFDPNLLYQFKIDNNGDAREDKVIQISFTGEGASQQVQVRGPLTPPAQGAMENVVADVSPVVTGALNTALGDANGIQVFAGPRDDPFFIDLEAAFCILPDRRPVGGTLSGSCALQPNPQAPFFFRNPGINYVNGFNVNSIVLELPSSMLENGAPGKLGIWGTISQ